MPDTKGILCIGYCCLDIVSEVKSYPKEDSDQRCITQSKQRGGNASNNTTILGLLGANAYYMGVLADAPELSFIKDDFKKYNVNTDCIVIQSGYEMPVSTVILSVETGSRTIIQYNPGLPNANLEHLQKLDLHKFSWIHFEGRNAKEIIKMVDYIRLFCSKNNVQITISIELEKPKPDLEILIPYADVLYISRDFALMLNWKDMETTVNEIYNYKLKPRGAVICPWGSCGAAGKYDKDSPSCCVGAFPPDRIVDTLGAGDTFIGTTIYSMNKNRNNVDKKTKCQQLKDAILLGCKIAGAKIGLRGWNPEMKNIVKDVLYN